MQVRRKADFPLRLRERSIRKIKAAIQGQRSKVGVVVNI